MSFPGWKSHRAVGRTHSVSEIFEIVFLGLLVGFDIAASIDTPRETLFKNLGIASLAGLVIAEAVRYVYSRREKTLSDTEADLQLAEIRRNQMSRSLAFPIGTFIESLKSKPTARVDILYQPEDGEALMFATNLWHWLLMSGWEVPHQPVPVPADLTTGGLRAASPEVLKKLPSVMRVGGQPTGVSVIARSLEGMPHNRNTPFGALMLAFIDSRFPIGAGLDESLPESVFRLVVGSKP